MEFNWSDWHWGYFAFYLLLGAALYNVIKKDWSHDGTKSLASRVNEISGINMLLVLILIAMAHDHANVAQEWFLISLAEIGVGAFAAHLVATQYG